MRKIKTKTDAIKLAVLLMIDKEELGDVYPSLCLEESPVFETWYCADYDAEKPCVQLWDGTDSNRILIFLERDTSWTHSYRFKMAFVDTVNGKERFCTFSLYEVADVLWANRGYINKNFLEKSKFVDLSRELAVL